MSIILQSVIKTLRKIINISVLNHEGEPVHTTQTICKLHERNAREEVLNSSQFIKIQKVKVKTDLAFGICRCINSTYSLRGKDMVVLGIVLIYFLKKINNNNNKK